MKETYIYVASPYSHPDYRVMIKRYERVRAYVAECLNNGEVVYSPINDNHPITAHHDLPTHWEFWKKVDTAFIRGAHKLRVYQMDGWDKSVGVAAEIEYAKEIGLDVEYIRPDKS